MNKIISPWGKMWVLIHIKVFWLKIIRVDKGHRTSSQYHFNRTELHIGLDRWHWKYIIPKKIHRMTEGLYLELAWGIPTEVDICRISDDYDRY